MDGQKSRRVSYGEKYEPSERKNVSKMAGPLQAYAAVKEAYDLIEMIRRSMVSKEPKRVLRNPFYSICSFVGSLLENEYDYELFAVAGRERLELKVLDPASFLSPLNEAKGLLLMSGTMPSKDYVEKVWGIGGCEEIRISKEYPEDYYSVFPRDAKSIEVISDVTTAWQVRKKGGDRWSRRYAEIADAAFNMAKKSVLVSCPSYSVAQRIFESVKSPKYLETRETSIQDVVEKVIESRIVVVAVARGKVLEGVEFVDGNASLVDCVIIAGVPFPVPDELHEWRARKIMRRLVVSENDSNFKSAYFMREPALTLVRQAVGRAIRFPSDRATIYLADERFGSDFWRNGIA
jgi:DNA excision repair protein ERCC-2